MDVITSSLDFSPPIDPRLACERRLHLRYSSVTRMPSTVTNRTCLEPLSSTLDGRLPRINLKATRSELNGVTECFNGGDEHKRPNSAI